MSISTFWLVNLVHLCTLMAHPKHRASVFETMGKSREIYQEIRKRSDVGVVGGDKWRDFGCGGGGGSGNSTTINTASVQAKQHVFLTAESAHFKFMKRIS